MKNIFLIGLLLILTISCKKDRIETPPISGIWIETIHKSDTLVFENEYPSFTLNRGTEIRDGYLLPKYSSGPYSYEIVQDSISLRWGLSSYSGSFKYYFNLDEKNEHIKIGNFFIDSLYHDNVTLTFSRLN